MPLGTRKRWDSSLSSQLAARAEAEEHELQEPLVKRRIERFTYVTYIVALFSSYKFLGVLFPTLLSETPFGRSWLTDLGANLCCLLLVACFCCKPCQSCQCKGRLQASIMGSKWEVVSSELHSGPDEVGWEFMWFLFLTCFISWIFCCVGVFQTCFPWWRFSTFLKLDVPWSMMSLRHFVCRCCCLSAARKVTADGGTLEFLDKSSFLYGKHWNATTDNHLALFSNTNPKVEKPI